MPDNNVTISGGTFEGSPVTAGNHNTITVSTAGPAERADLVARLRAAEPALLAAVDPDERQDVEDNLAKIVTAAEHGTPKPAVQRNRWSTVTSMVGSAAGTGTALLGTIDQITALVEKIFVG